MLEIIVRLECEIQSAVLVEGASHRDLCALWDHALHLSRSVSIELGEARLIRDQVLLARLLRAQSQLLRSMNRIHSELARSRQKDSRRMPVMLQKNA